MKLIYAIAVVMNIVAAGLSFSRKDGRLDYHGHIITALLFLILANVS